MNIITAPFKHELTGSPCLPHANSLSAGWTRTAVSTSATTNGETICFSLQHRTYTRWYISGGILLWVIACNVTYFWNDELIYHHHQYSPEHMLACAKYSYTSKANQELIKYEFFKEAWLPCDLHWTPLNPPPPKRWLRNTK